VTGSGRGANARTSEAAETRGNACPGAALEGGCASGSAADGCASGRMRSGATHCRGRGRGRADKHGGAMRTLPGAGQYQALPPSQSCRANGFRCEAFLTGKVSFSGKAREPFAEEIAP
jgi:hypothetical protein